MFTRAIKTSIASLALASTASASQVDLSKSEIIWTGSKVVGSSHTGSVQLKSAEIKTEKGEPKSAHLVIDMNSIKNKDLTDEKWNQKLVGHLKSADFFDVENHPNAEFKVKDIQKASDKHYLLIGDLVIKGKSHPIKVKADVIKDTKDLQVVKADFEFDRTKWDVKYGSGSFFSNLGDKMISDEVKMSVKLSIKKDQALAKK